MNDSLLNLNFNHWGVFLLSIIPALINFGICIYAVFFLPQNKTNSAFFLFVLLLGITQFADGFMRMSISAETAMVWCRMSTVAIVFAQSFGLLFTVRFTGWNKKIADSKLLLLLFILPILFEFLIIARLDKYTFVKSERWNWIVNTESTPVTNSIALWIIGIGLIILTLLWIYYFKERTAKQKKRQAVLLAIGFTIPFVVGVTTELIFPLIFHIDDIPLSTPLITIFSVASFVAIKKYNMLDYSPRHQWNNIVETMNEGILIVNNKDQIMYANKTLCKLLGYKFNEIEGRVAYEIFENELFEKKMETIIEERKSKKSGQYEIKLKTKSGGKIWMNVSGSPYLDRNNNVIGSIGILTNITSLKESELRLKQAQAIAHVGSWEINFAANTSIWSEEACRIYGLSPNDNYQSFESWMSFIHPEDIDDVKKEIEKSRISFRDFSFFHRIVHKSGIIKHVYSERKFEFNSEGKPIGIYGVVHDVTEFKKLENEAIQNEQRFKTFMQESLLSIYFFNAKTKKVVYANPAFCQLTGYSLEELDTLTLYDFVNHSKENIDSFVNITLQKKQDKVGEREWRRKDGKLIQVFINASYIKDNDSEMVSITAQDITEKKKTEDQLKATNQELGTFVYKASHDLRSPLASIMGLVNVSKIEIKDEKSLEFLNMIDVCTNRLDNILKGLVQSMQIKDAKEKEEEINFDQLISETLKNFEYYNGFSRLVITHSVSVFSPFYSSKLIIGSIFQNMIENAIKYQNYTNKESFLKITITENNKIIQAVFEDNGIGIDSSFHNEIFEMYFKAHCESKGSGLGLYLVNTGIKKLNGKIKIESEKGKGAKFIISLPIDQIPQLN